MRMRFGINPIMLSCWLCLVQTLPAKFVTRGLTAELRLAIHWIQKDLVRQGDAIDAFPPGPLAFLEGLGLIRNDD